MDLWRQSITRDGALVGDPTRVTAGLEVQEASLSADGTKVAYSKGRQIANVWRAPIFTDQAASWAEAQQITFEHAFIEFVNLSPDGRRLAVQSDRSGNPGLWILPADGGGMQAVATGEIPNWFPRWSPDGKQIAFYSNRSGNRDIWVLPVNGGPARQLTFDPAADLAPDWSPDGHQIVFMSRRGPEMGLWVVPVIGGEARSLMSGPANAPTWSPDGQWIAFSSSRGGEIRQIWRVHSDATSAESLTTGSGDNPAWSPDGHQLFFNRSGELGADVWAISLDDRHERPITHLAGRRGSLLGVSPTTDGRRLFYIWEETLSDIWAMDVTKARPE